MVGKRRVGAFPPGGALLAGDNAGPRVPAHRAVLQFNQRLRDEVVLASRVLGSAALGCDGRILPIVLDSHHRGFV